MKLQYSRVDENHRWYYNERNHGRYALNNAYYRRVCTMNERRQNCAAMNDGYAVRGRRRKLPTSWDDARISRDWGRSWKDYTKRKKQYHGA